MSYIAGAQGKRGYRSVPLPLRPDTGSWNAPAVLLYQKNGFEALAGAPEKWEMQLRMKIIFT
ncbi:MAG: hypothetical protein OSJ58_03125 [Dysosmobacter sp.]|nr:hypothetical protein [Dysosmobacter sp.]